MNGLDHAGAIPAWEKVVGGKAGAFPCVLVDDFFSFIVDVVDGSFLHFAVYVPEGMKHGHVADSEAVGELVVVHEAVLFYFKHEPGLSHCRTILTDRGVDYVVVVVDSVLVFALLLMLKFV
jgi:hypothetical protein